MPDDLIERARYCHEHGIFDASRAGMMVSYGELADAIERLTARAEAAEARVKALEEALRRVMIGGNHLALLIGADHPAYGTEHYTALEHCGAGDQYEAWCAWNAIMLACAALGGEHDK